MASLVGHAKATTPLLPVPLQGPAYFVSNGGQAFPNLIMVLQGYGVTIDLVGDTFINKRGITSSTFKTVPDVPVGSFELTLPQGKFSAARRHRQPLQVAAEDADNVCRAERRRDPQKHQDRRDRLLQAPSKARQETKKATKGRHHKQ